MCYGWAIRTTPPTWRKTGFRLKTVWEKHSYSPTSFTNPALLLWHYYYAINKVRSFKDQKWRHMQIDFQNQFSPKEGNFNPSKNSVRYNNKWAEFTQWDTNPPQSESTTPKTAYRPVLPDPTAQLALRGGFYCFTLPLYTTLIIHFSNTAQQDSAFLPALNGNPKTQFPENPKPR